MRASNERTFVDKNEFACNRQHFDYWQPADNSVRLGSLSIPIAGSRLLMLAAAVAVSAVVILCMFTLAFSALTSNNRTQAAGQPTPTVVAAATQPPAQPTALPSKLKIGNTDGYGACIRVDAAIGSTCVRAWPDGTVLDVVGPDKTVDGKPWRNVKDSANNTGWLLAEYLLPAE